MSSPTAYLSIESSSVKAVSSLVCEKNGVLLVWLGSRNCEKKLFAVSNSFWCHFTAHICGYIAIIAYMDLTIASKKY